MITEKIMYFKRDHLARRVTLMVFICGVILTIIATFVLTVSDYQNEINLLENRLEAIETIEVPSLSNSIWHFDHKQIETQLQGILNFQDVAYEQLEITGGETLVFGRVIQENKSLSRSYTIEYIQEDRVYSLGKLTVIADLENLQQRVSSRLLVNLLNAGVQIFLLASLILFILDRLFVRPLSDVAHYTETLDIDHLAKPLVLQRYKNPSSEDELDLVAIKINEMRLRLLADIEEHKKMEAALTSSERNYREIFNATSEAIVIHDAETGKILQVNASMLNMFGYSSEAEVLELSVNELSSSDPQNNLERIDQLFIKTRTEGPQISEWVARRKNGETFWVEISLRNTVISGSNRILAVLRDISESKRNSSLLHNQNVELLIQKGALEKARTQLRKFNMELEQRVKERTLQLADLNAELESFSYSVAHDLKSPLRSISAYSSLILDDHRDQLDRDILEYLNNIQTASHRMEELIEDMLKLSKVNRGDLTLSDINLAPIAVEILEELRKLQPERQAEIIISPDLPAFADHNLLTIALDNLLRNAWKFSSKQKNTHIEVGSYFKNGQRVFFVSDNGVGFNMNYSQKMFKPFERFHSLNEFEGTGIGLAITHRIIQRHHGNIWAESEVDKGAKFFFTLTDNNNS